MIGGIWRWTGIDEKAEKYVSVSPYVYCLNKTPLIVDNDGKDNMIYLLNLHNSGITAAQAQSIVDASNQAFKDLGLNTRVQMFQGNAASFNPQYLDKTDAFAVMGTKEDMGNYISEFNKEFGEEVRGMPGMEKGKVFGNIIAVESGANQMIAEEYNSGDLSSVGAVSILHGAGHNASGGGHDGSSNSILRWDGARLISAITGQSFIIDGQVVSEGRSINGFKGALNNRPLEGYDRGRNEDYIKLIKSRFGTNDASDNYDTNERYYEQLHNFKGWGY